jgi:recA bacterial DNA recombination protein
MSSVSVRALTAVQLVSNAGSVSDLLSGVVPASRLERPVPPMVSTGIAALDSLTGGLPRGALTEIFGPASSGRSSVLLSVLAEMTARQEVCALVDVTDCFDPESAAAADVDLSRVLWVRCSGQSTFNERPIRRGSTRMDTDQKSKIRNQKSKIINGPISRCSWRRLEQALKATDLLLQGGGFGLVVVDLGDVPPQAARRVPLTSWFRFRRTVENTPTVLVAITQEPCARTCASLVLRCHAQLSAFSSQLAAKGQSADSENDEMPTHGRILRGLRITAEIVRSRMEQKKASRSTSFESQTVWQIG